LLPELGDGSAESHTEFGEREQFLLFDAVAALLRTLAAEHDLILVLDDLHWADVPTLQMLRHVSRATEGASLLVLGTYRETEVDETHPLAATLAELRRARVLDHLELVGLGEEEVGALICSLAGSGAPPTPPTVARSIVDRTQGNPLFVEELLRDVAVDHDFGRALTGVPESVKELLLRRLRQLDDACKQALTVGAVSGGEFELLVLERVTDTAPDELAESLEQAITAHIVDESPASVGRYSFAHSLIRETIYEQLSRTRRAQLHRRIGEAIERVYPERLDEHASELALHFSAARDVAKAYENHARAAAAAHRVYAVEPALAHYTAAIDAATELGLDSDHEPALRVLLLQRARMRYRTGDVSGAAADVRAVLDASRRCGDRATEMEALNELGATEFHTDVNRAAACHEAAAELARELGDPGAEANALDRLAVIASHQLQFDRALEIGERALVLARETGDASGLGRAIDSIKLAVWQLGDLERLKALTDELEHLWRARGELWYLQWTLLESAFVPIAQARWEEASERLAGALAISAQLRDSTAEVVIQDALCWLARSRGAYDEALSAGRRAVALAPDAAWPGWAAATLGWTLLDLGAAAAAAEVLEGGLAEGERPGAPNETVRCVSQLAWARWMLGDEDQASALTARAMKMLGRVSAPEGGAWLFGAGAYAAVGRVLVAAGESDRAESLLVPVHGAAARSGWRDAEATTGLCWDSASRRAASSIRLARRFRPSSPYPASAGSSLRAGRHTPLLRACCGSRVAAPRRMSTWRGPRRSSSAWPRRLRTTRCAVSCSRRRGSSPEHLVPECFVVAQRATRVLRQCRHLRGVHPDRRDLACVGVRVQIVDLRRQVVRRKPGPGEAAVPECADGILRGRMGGSRHPCWPAAHVCVREVGVQEDREPVGSQLERRRADQAVIGMVGECRRGVDDGTGLDHLP
jgi:tetratricopeptide (TPR) repeat protein